MIVCLPRCACPAVAPACLTPPQGEPLLPDQQEVFLLPGEWLHVPLPQYEHIKRNLWVSRKRPTRLHKEEISVCYCSPPQLQYDDTGRPIALGGCVEGCLNRMSSIHCDQRSCPCGDLCSNKPFHMLKMPKLQTFLTENRCAPAVGWERPGPSVHSSGGRW